MTDSDALMGVQMWKSLGPERSSGSAGNPPPWRKLLLLMALTGGILLWLPTAPPSRSPAPGAPDAERSVAPGGGVPSISPARVTGGLLLAVAAAIGLALLLSRTSLKTRRGGLVEVLDYQSLGQKRGLLVVRAAGRRFLLGTSERGLQHLAELDEEPLAGPVVADGPPEDAFSGMLLRASKPFRDKAIS